MILTRLKNKEIKNVNDNQRMEMQRQCMQVFERINQYAKNNFQGDWNA